MAKVTTEEQTQIDTTTEEVSLDQVSLDPGSTPTDALLTEGTVTTTEKKVRDNTLKDQAAERQADQSLEFALYAEENVQLQNQALQQQTSNNPKTAVVGGLPTTKEDVTDRTTLEMEMEQDKLRKMQRSNREEVEQSTSYEELPLHLLQEADGQKGQPNSKPSAEEQAKEAAQLKALLEKELSNPAELEQVQTSLSDLAERHINDATLRESAELRLQESNLLIEELSGALQFDSLVGDLLSQFYMSEYQQLEAKRALDVEGAKTALAVVARSHAESASFRALSKEERLASVNKRIEQIQEELNLSQAETAVFLAEYEKQYHTSASTYEARDKEVIDKVSGDINTLVASKATVEAQDLNTDGTLTTLFTDKFPDLSPAQQLQVETLYKERLTEVRTQRYLQEIERLASSQASRDLGTKSDTTTSESAIESRFADLEVADRLRTSTYQNAYKARKEILTATGGDKRSFADRVRGIGQSLSNASDFALAAVVSPVIGAARLVDSNTMRAAGDLLKTGLVWAKDTTVSAAKAVVTDPIGSGKAVLSFGKSVADSMGLTNIATGLWGVVKSPVDTAVALGKGGASLLSDAVKVAKGEKSLSDLKDTAVFHAQNVLETSTRGVRELGTALKGTVMLAGELTGVTDVIMAGKYALQGDFKMAAMHSAFAVMSASALAATVVTAGAAAPAVVGVAMGRTTLKAAGKQVLKTATKEFMQQAGKQIGQEFLEQVGKETIQQTAMELTQEAAEKGVREIAEKIAKDSSLELTSELVEQTQKELTQKLTTEKLLKLGLDDFVDNKVQALLKLGSDPRKLRAHLVEMGIDNKATREKIVKEVNKAIKNGTSDLALKEVLTESISEPIEKALLEGMEAQFKATYREGLAKAASGELTDEAGQALGKALREGAEKAGKEIDEFIEEMTESAWKGHVKGVKAAVREVVRKGIDAAFKKFRKRDRDFDTGRTNTFVPVKEETRPLTPKETEELVAAGVLGDQYAARLAQEKGDLLSKESVRVTTQTDARGNTLRIVERFDPDTASWESVSRDMVAAAALADAAAPIADEQTPT